MSIENRHSPEISSNPQEIFKIGEWIEVTDKSPIYFAQLLEEKFEELAKNSGYSPVYPPVSQRSMYVIKNLFGKVFSNGLKNKDVLDKPGCFKYRLVEVPEKFLQMENLVMAVAYELEIKLIPRYQIDGESVNFVARFVLNSRKLTKKEMTERVVSFGHNPVYVRTTVDRKYTSKSEKGVVNKAENVKNTSVQNWSLALWEKMPKIVSGGLPGLGKKSR